MARVTKIKAIWPNAFMLGLRLFLLISAQTSLPTIIYLHTLITLHTVDDLNSLGC